MHHILVVNPEPSIRIALKEGLSSKTFEVHVAKDGAEGLRLVSKGYYDYDIIIVSLVLPDMNGYKVIRRIHSRWPETIAIAITEKTAKEESINGLKHGVSMYLEKPLEMKSITDAIARGLEQWALKHKAPQI